MIEGLKLDISTDKLREHLLARSAYHAKRREHYLAEFRRTTEITLAGEEALDDDEGFTNTSSYGGGSTDMQRAKGHRSKAAFFKFVAEYLVPAETYRLTETDLAKFELTVGLM